MRVRGRAGHLLNIAMRVLFINVYSRVLAATITRKARSRYYKVIRNIGKHRYGGANERWDGGTISTLSHHYNVNNDV
jgi:hypothetical protein